MKERIFETEQRISRPRHEVFEFFSDAKNLERITPPWLKFKILSQSSPKIGFNTEFKYRLQIHGLPVFWKTRIIEWNPPDSFVDFQEKGPYSLWHHTHTFVEDAHGTLMTDRVRYRVPLGALGDFLLGEWVTRDVQEIFEYRAKAIEEIFSSKNTKRA